MGNINFITRQAAIIATVAAIKAAVLFPFIAAYEVGANMEKTDKETLVEKQEIIFDLNKELEDILKNISVPDAALVSIVNSTDTDAILADNIPAAPKGYTYSGSFSVMATAYTLGRESCKGSADGRTATNYKVKPHDYVVAVDPDVIPLGSRVYVPDYGMAMAIDVGSKIQGNRIDVLMTVKKDRKTPYQRAMHWGNKNLDIVVYTKSR